MMAASAHMTRPAKVALRLLGQGNGLQVYMAANILLLYGPKTQTTANAEKTRPKRMWHQVYMANGIVPLYVSKTQTRLSI